MSRWPDPWKLLQRSLFDEPPPQPGRRVSRKKQEPAPLQALSFGLPAILYDHKCSGSEAYIMLAQELMQRERERAAA